MKTQTNTPALPERLLEAESNGGAEISLAIARDALAVCTAAVLEYIRNGGV